MQLTNRQLTGIRGRKKPYFPIRSARCGENYFCCWLTANWEVWDDEWRKEFIYLAVSTWLVLRQPSSAFSPGFSRRVERIDLDAVPDDPVPAASSNSFQALQSRACRLQWPCERRNEARFRVCNW